MFFIEISLENDVLKVKTWNNDMYDMDKIEYITNQEWFNTYVSNTVLDWSWRKSKFIDDFKWNIELTIEEMQKKIKWFLNL